MAGYKRNRKIYNLVFNDPDMNGLEVKTRSTSLGGFLKIVELAMKMQLDGTSELDVGAVEDLFGRFSRVIISWNLEDDARECRDCSAGWFDLDEVACPKCGHEDWSVVEDAPVPVTKKALLDQDLDFVMAIVNAWTSAVGDVGDDLKKGSTSGGKFPEVSIPMELLSKNPQS
jgi:hypothetical protein